MNPSPASLPGGSARQRLLAALACQEPAPIPCSFMMYRGLKDRCASYLDFLNAQMALGLEPFVELPVREPGIANDHYNLHGLPVEFSPQVQVVESKLVEPDGQTLLIKEMHTPAGSLRTELLKPALWSFGDHIPFLDDHIIPLTRRFPVSHPADLPALAYLLQAPTPAHIQAYHAQSQPALEFSRSHGLPLVGGWGVGADLVGWICGLREMILLSYRQPDLLAELLGMISAWNQARMQVCLQLPLDLYIKRAWYENMDFFTPAAWQHFILPHLQAEASLAHAHGAKFGYIMTSNPLPIVESIMDAGVDVLIGVDPREVDLVSLAAHTRGKLALWGGVNGHITVETGTPAQVAAEVNAALSIFRESGGFILSPVDNIRNDSPAIQANVRTLIDTWRSAA